MDGDDRRLVKLLQAHNPDLIEMFHGAIDAIEGRHADWQRHAMTSLRELATAVMHSLASDAAVLAANPQAECSRDRRPTRRSRLGFIFAQAGPAAEFFVTDIEEGVELFDRLNAVTHLRTEKPSLEQIRALRQRAVSLLTTMLNASGFE